MKPSGYLVMESAQQYEQGLTLRRGPEYPAAGILQWGSPPDARAIFADRVSAKAAIQRTEHYRLAFGRGDLPEKKYCRVVPVVQV
jgi:hypothetical protein